MSGEHYNCRRADQPKARGNEPPRYRVTFLGRARGPWRDAHEHAMEDAIAAGLASYDRSRREHFLAVPTEIEIFLGDSPPR